MTFILDRYLLREVIHSWLWVTLVVWVILLCNQLVRYLGKAVAGEVPAQEVFVLLGLSAVGFLVVLLPLSLYLAIVLALGRLYKDSEMAALGACGIGAPRLYRPLLSLALVVGAALAWFSLVLAPAATQMRHQLEDQAEQRTDFSLLTPGRFQEVHDGKLVIYAEQLSPDREKITNLLVETKLQGRSGLLTAEHAFTESDAAGASRILLMEDGSRYDGSPGEDDFRIMKFNRYGIRLPSMMDVNTDIEVEAKPTRELWGSVHLEDIAELQWRLSAPLAVLVLTLLAVPLSRTTPRQGQYGKLFVAVLGFIVYYNLMATAKVWVEQAVISPKLGVWWVHGLAALLAFALLAWGRPEIKAGRRGAKPKSTSGPL